MLRNGNTLAESGSVCGWSALVWAEYRRAPQRAEPFNPIPRAASLLTSRSLRN